MKKLTILSLALVAVAARAQSTSQSQIRHIETSMNHLTVLEFGESVTTLAIADPDSFQVERHDDKVFLKPLREGVSTNLFVWTASRELSYELDPAGQLAQMDVLVRAEPVPNPHTGTQASAEPSDTEIRKIASLVLTQAMMGVEDIVHDAEKRATGRVEVDLEQVYRAKDRRDQGSVPRHDSGCVRPGPDRAAYLAPEPQESSDHVSDLHDLQSETGFRYRCDAGRFR